jgi:hypothetical protein
VSCHERVETAELPRPIGLGRSIKRELEAAHEIVHPLEPELPLDTDDPLGTGFLLR